jgi:hypothetical protein
VDAPCLDCNAPLHVEVCDGEIISQNAEGMIGYTDVPLAKWAQNWSFT